MLIVKRIDLRIKLLLLNLYIMYVFLISIVIKSIEYKNFNSWIFYVSLIIVFNFFIHIWVFRKIGIKLFSMIGLFVIFLYIFHFGQIIVIGLFPIYEFKNFNYIRICDVFYLKETVNICILFINMLVVGIIISNKYKFTNQKNNSNRISNNSLNGDQHTLNLCRKIGWVTLILSAPFQLYTDISNLMIAYIGGYSATFSSGRSGIITAIGYFMFTALALLIIGYKNDKKKSTRIFLFSITYLLITMLTGNRGHQMVALIVIIYVASKTMFQIRLRNCVFAILILWFGAVFTNLIYDTRAFGINYLINNFSTIIRTQLIANPFIEIIESFGETIYTPYLVLNKMGTTIKPAFGITYLYSLFSLLPNIGGVFTNINNASAFQKMLNTPVIGGSFIGELFYNFKYFGVIPATFFGFILNRISQKVEKAFVEHNYVILAYLLPVFINSLWWTRDSFAYIIRPIIWQAIFTFFLYMLFKEKEKEIYYINEQTKY